ncbi:Calumenin [Holothuria leucospilota]|uniref:Reticulocalbin-3 n=1 Tax=Holothuria leucospilota TaxID=206669 RepID=A0A9Q0YKN3_HOLLE|nr:Calumenin [Holothuria leucospilota]
MQCSQCMVLALTLTLATVLAKPAENDRVRKDPKLSGQEHFAGDGHEHNADYDHDAFLGEEDAKTFDSLTPEESMDRLGKIVDRIDKNKDGFVVLDELKKHIEHQQHMSNVAHSTSVWKIRDYNRDGHVTLQEYIYMAYGVITSKGEDELVQLEENERMDFRKMIRRDKKRWNYADQDRNGHLNIDEFTSFLHPEESPHMRSIVIEETLEDIDRDGDGLVSLEEYIGDMFKPESPNEPEPAWVAQEREQFGLYRDRNKDGKMDQAEIGEWILPTEYDHAEAEAKHLMYEADTNKDDKLTKKEILDSYDLFVGSQATDFGEALTRHDEF